MRIRRLRARITHGRSAVSILGLLIVSLLLPVPARALGVSRIDAPEHFEIRLHGRAIAFDAVDGGYTFRDLADPSVEGFIDQDAIDRSRIHVVRTTPDRIVATLVTDGDDGRAGNYRIEGSYDPFGTGFSGTLFTPSGSSSTLEVSGEGLGAPRTQVVPSPTPKITTLVAAVIACSIFAVLKDCIGDCLEACLSQRTTMCSARDGSCGTCECVCATPDGNCQ